MTENINNPSCEHSRSPPTSRETKDPDIGAKHEALQGTRHSAAFYSQRASTRRLHAEGGKTTMGRDANDLPRQAFSSLVVFNDMLHTNIRDILRMKYHCYNNMLDPRLWAGLMVYYTFYLLIKNGLPLLVRFVVNRGHDTFPGFAVREALRRIPRGERRGARDDLSSDLCVERSGVRKTSSSARV